MIRPKYSATFFFSWLEDKDETKQNKLRTDNEQVSVFKLNFGWSLTQPEGGGAKKIQVVPNIYQRFWNEKDAQKYGRSKA